MNKIYFFISLKKKNSKIKKGKKNGKVVKKKNM